MVREGMFPKDFDRNKLGSCMRAAALATSFLLSKNIKNFKVIEGWVYFPEVYDEEDEDNWSAHTWIQFDNGRIFDPTWKQWRVWGFDKAKDQVKFITWKVHKEYDPEEYIKDSL